jgi:hypothetical protein
MVSAHVARIQKRPPLREIRQENCPTARGSSMLQPSLEAPSMKPDRPMAQSLALALALALALTLLAQSAGCSKDAEEAHVEVLKMPAFENIRARGSFAMDITHGPVQKVTVTGTKDDVAQVVTGFARGNRLEIEAPKALNGNPPLTVTIELPKLKALYAAGDLRVSVRKFEQKGILFDVAGTTRLIASGIVDYAQMDATGMSHVDASHLSALRVEAVASGNCSMEVRAKDVLKVEIAGKSEVGYFGSPPTIKKSITNGGTVVYRGP